MKRTNRQKKITILKELRETYKLPVIECSRYGTKKGFTRTDLLKGMLWTVFSKWIRRRDTKNGKGACISCGALKTYEELQAGHFAPAGGNSVALLFMEENVNGECEKCNGFDPFHLVRMKENLIKKYGKKKVEEIERLEHSHISEKWSEQNFVDKIKYYAEQ